MTLHWQEQTKPELESLFGHRSGRKAVMDTVSRASSCADLNKAYLLAKTGACGSISGIALRGEALSNGVDEGSGPAKTSRIALRKIRISRLKDCLSHLHTGEHPILPAELTMQGWKLQTSNSISNQFQSRDLRQ